jgi:hypothetical protein
MEEAYRKEGDKKEVLGMRYVMKLPHALIATLEDQQTRVVERLREFDEDGSTTDTDANATGTGIPAFSRRPSSGF